MITRMILPGSTSRRPNCWRLFAIVCCVAVNASASTSLLEDANLPNDRLELKMLHSSEGDVANDALLTLETPALGNYVGDFKTTLFGTSDRSSSRFALAAASSSTNIVLYSDQTLVLSGGPGETVTLDLRNFVMLNQATLTLEGTATTSFVINVTKQFSLSGTAKVVLSGGIQCDNVFFNVLGRGHAVSLRGSASLVGTLTASQRVVRMGGHSMCCGEVFAKKIILRGAAQIIPCPVASQ